MRRQVQHGGKGLCSIGNFSRRSATASPRCVSHQIFSLFPTSFLTLAAITAKLVVVSFPTFSLVPTATASPWCVSHQLFFPFFQLFLHSPRSQLSLWSFRFPPFRLSRLPRPRLGVSLISFFSLFPTTLATITAKLVVVSFPTFSLVPTFPLPLRHPLSHQHR